MNPTHCPCGNPSHRDWKWCTQCLQRNLDAVHALLLLCSKEHRGAGAGVICICGAGCGGSKACQGLELLKSAITGNAENRFEIARLFGWESYMDHLSASP